MKGRNRKQSRMINDKEKRLVSLLLERTDHHSIKWRSTEVENEFEALIGDNRVRLREGINPFSAGIATAYTVTLCDADGRIVDIFSDTELLSEDHQNKWYQILRDLYVEARNSALGSESVIDSLLDQLAKD